jgi:hypothetical protein
MKLLTTLLLLFALLIDVNAKPVTITINKPGKFEKTERWEDPSTCRTFDKITCSPLDGSVCYTVTYTYDDGTVTNFNNDLQEGDQFEPINILIQNNNGVILSQGLVSFYQTYVLTGTNGLEVVYEYGVNYSIN